MINTSYFLILGHRFRHGVNTEDRKKLHRMAVELVAGVVHTKMATPPLMLCSKMLVMFFLFVLIT